MHFDIFLSSPMSAFSRDTDYQYERFRMLELIDIFSNTWNASKIYYAGEHFTSTSSFDSATLSLSHCLSALENSELFVMIYPKKIVSSVLIEAGYALSQRTKSIYFVKNIKTLPYILREPEGISPAPKIYIYKTFEQLKKYISENKETILNFTHQMSLFDISLINHD